MLRHTGAALTSVRAIRCHLTRPTLPACSVSSSMPIVAAAASQSAVPIPMQFTRAFAIKVSKEDKAKQAGSKTKDDAAKKKKKKKGPASDDGGGSLKNADLTQLEALLEQQLTAPDIPDTRSPAELALDHEYAKEYSRRCISAHKLHRVAQMAFLKSRWTAINALPTPLRTEALKEDMTPWPKGFQPIPWTPREYVKRFGSSQTTQAVTVKK